MAIRAVFDFKKLPADRKRLFKALLRRVEQAERHRSFRRFSDFRKPVHRCYRRIRRIAIRLPVCRFLFIADFAIFIDQIVHCGSISAARLFNPFVHIRTPVNTYQF